ncbi:MAG: selenium cofactor biosynthesis protein YqeC [Candidatus Binatia bacterium]
MTLKEALGLGDEKMLCLIGAGGKTTTLFRLAHELWQEDRKVLTSTTTRIFKPTSPHVHKLYLAQDLEALRLELAKTKNPMIVGVGTGLDNDGKLIGLPPAWFDALKEGGEVDWILVEADGAASRSFKVPLEHEPVVPERCDVAVWVMGIKALGEPITSDWVHRAERAATLLGVKAGTPLTHEHILFLLRDPSGCLKGVPPKSRKVALINQVDGEVELERARELGRAFVQHGLERVVVTSYLDKRAVKDVITR